MTGSFCDSIVNSGKRFIEYDTVKIVHVTNKKVGVIKRLIQLGVLAYILGYGIT